MLKSALVSRAFFLGVIKMSARIKAFAIHLSASAFIACLCVILVFLFWYPAPLHTALDVTQIFLLLLLVDVCLGPLLTLVVYKVGKKTLVFDLIIILLFQLAALSYGLWTVYSARPAWLVFNVDRFDVVQAIEIDTRKLEGALPDFKAPAWFGPRWVGAMRPENASEREAIMFESVLYGSDIAQRPDLYRPINEFTAQIKVKALLLNELSKYNGEDEIKKALAPWPDAKLWLPLKARSKPMIVLLDEQGSILAIVNLNPWE